MPKTRSCKSLELKMSSIMAASVWVREMDFARLGAILEDITGGARDFFDNELAIIDLSELDRNTRKIEWRRLIALLRNYRLCPVAVRHAPVEFYAEILAHGLSIESSEQSCMPHRVTEKSSTELIESPRSSPTMIIDTPVRGGQRIYAKNSDLIVTAAVNCGAEVIADGSIHVYAPLRGRALAGASGNAQARILTLALEAELVSIAGVYRTFENLQPEKIIKQPVQIRLKNECIDIQPIRF